MMDGGIEELRNGKYEEGYSKKASNEMINVESSWW